VTVLRPPDRIASASRPDPLFSNPRFAHFEPAGWVFLGGSCFRGDGKEFEWAGFGMFERFSPCLTCVQFNEASFRLPFSKIGNAKTGLPPVRFHGGAFAIVINTLSVGIFAGYLILIRGGIYVMANGKPGRWRADLGSGPSVCELVTLASRGVTRLFRVGRRRTSFYLH